MRALRVRLRKKTQYNVSDCIKFVLPIRFTHCVSFFASAFQMIAARDSLIEDLSKRYEQMREDFKYNLDLIEHRDSEISRLSRLRKVDKTELNEKELEIKSMANRLNVFERQEYEMKENIDAERAQFKVK